MNSRPGVAPNPRVAAKRRLAAVQTGPFAAAQSITAAQPFVAVPAATAAQPFGATQPRAVTQSIAAAAAAAPAPSFAPAPSDPFAAQPYPHLGSEPDTQPDSQTDPHVAVAETAWSVGPVASVSVLASFTEDADNARPSFAPSNSGDAFPTKFRAVSLVVGHALVVLSIFVLSLAATPVGHRFSHVGNTSVGLLAVLCVFVGLACTVVAAARVQHDIMGGGWDGGFAPRFISYISPEVALYVIGPSGISAASRQLNISAARVLLVEYGLLAASFLIVLHRYVAR